MSHTGTKQATRWWRTLRVHPLAAPFLVGSAALIVIPLFSAFYLAATEYYGFTPPQFSGLDNLKRLRADEAFWSALGVSMLVAVVAVPLRLCLAVGIALLTARGQDRLTSTTRVAAYLPSVVPEAAWALLWLWLLNPLYGPIPGLLQTIGWQSPGFLTTTWGARISLVLVLLFQIGEAFIVALAARRAIPEELLETLRLEGASAWFVTTRVTVPLMAPLVALLAARDVVLVMQGMFVPALLVTGGGPAYATTTAPLYIYHRAFEYGELGYASTLSVTLFVLTALAAMMPVLLAWRMSGRSVGHRKSTAST